MACKKVKTYLDDYLDGYLDNENQKQIRSHVHECQTCSLALQEEMNFRQSLKNLKVPLPSDNFIGNILQNVLAEHQRRKRARTRVAMGSALAACIAVLIITGVTFMSPGKSMVTPITILPLNKIKNINMVLGSSNRLDEARLTLHLPEYFYIDGYQGTQKLSWIINLKKGQNLLTLPVKAVAAGKMILVAKVEHQSRSRSYIFHLVINDNGEVGSRINLKQTINV